MAKKKAPPAKAAEPKPAVLPIIATIRGKEAFKGYLEECARKDRTSVAGFLERAAVFYGKHIGVEGEPPERQ